MDGRASWLDKAVEIDGYADRQDLKMSLLRLARTEGVRISLGTDAHHPWQLAFMNFSLAAAQLAGFPKGRILNFMSTQELRSWALKSRCATELFAADSAGQSQSGRRSGPL
jgi:histidinol phosphatase-like PHP family hydrolase